MNILVAWAVVIRKRGARVRNDRIISGALSFAIAHDVPHLQLIEGW
jgi:hypothetical protein